MSEAPVQHLDVEGIVVDADEALAIEEQLRKITDAAARLEHALPQERTELLQNPAVQAACAAHALQHVVAVVRREPIVEEPVLEQRPDRRERVLPADVLAFGGGAAVIADRYLVKADIPLRE